MWSSNVKRSEFHGQVTDFGRITNGEIKMNVKNAHVRKVIEVARSRISHHLLQKVVTLRVHWD